MIFEILLIVLIFVAILYALQLFIIAIMFYSDDYKNKKDLFRDLTPLRWLKSCIEYAYDETLKTWNKLE